jgi:predicted alpha/beta hydrolase family esterase
LERVLRLDHLGAARRRFLLGGSLMTDFGLVHGAYHGAWCWERLTPELERLGHRVFTVDLPAEDPEAGAAEYAAAAVTAFADAGEDLVLVGHSLGGLTIPLIAASRPVRQLIFLAAMIPRPGQTHDEVMAAEPDMVLPGPEGGAYLGSDGAVRWRPEAAASWFYADCPAELAAWAAARLRGQFWAITSEMSPLSAWPGTPCAYLLGSHDPVINPAWSRSAARTVLGVQPVELDVGHTPFLAAPALMAQVIADVSADPGTGSPADVGGRGMEKGVPEPAVDHP